MHSCASDNVKLAESSKLQLNNRKDLIESIAKGFVGFAAAATALASICFDSPAFAESLTVAFPASRAPEVIFSFFSPPVECLYFWVNFLCLLREYSSKNSC